MQPLFVHQPNSMRYFTLVSSLIGLFCASAEATWQKVNEADYVWGPFKIYNIALFSETGEYTPDTRPLMLTLKYVKPVDGRDFAISLARSWSNLGITLPEQDSVVDRLKKIVPNIKVDDRLSYIALNDRGYFVLNDSIIPEEFNTDFNNAILAVWLDPQTEMAGKLLSEKHETIESHEGSEPRTEPANTPEKPKESDPTQEIMPPSDLPPVSEQPTS